jgi:hypothetical protein
MGSSYEFISGAEAGTRKEHTHMGSSYEFIYGAEAGTCKI